MSIFNKVTLQSLKRNKTRTTVTIIGIMLSAAMICAVTTCVSSLQNYMLQNAVYENGDWHGCSMGQSWSVYEKTASSDKVEKAVCAQQVGYAEAKDCINEYKPYLYILGISDGFENTVPVHMISGELPKNQNEIILPDHLGENGGIYYKIGDEITLDVGLRMSDGCSLGQNNPCYVYDEMGKEAFNEEKLEIKAKRTYKVVGFYERPNFEEHTAPGYTVITRADINRGADAVYDIYFKMKDPDTVYDFMTENSLEGNTNSEVLMFNGISVYGNFSVVLTNLAAIIIVLIIFGSVSLIYNAFSISVSERTKQFGLLSSVGATKRQLRGMVFFEAFAVSVVGIPLGIIAGIGGIGVTLLFIGNRISSIYGSSDIPMRICVSLPAVIIAIAVSLITVFISAMIPSKRATKVSAIEAIRQSNDIKVSKNKVKTSKLIYKIFGLPGMLASKHYKRSQKKYRATVISLFMSIVLFISSSAFTEYLTESVEGSFTNVGYDIRYYSGETADVSSEKLLDIIKNTDGVKDAAYTKSRYLNGEISKKFLNSEAVEVLKDSITKMTDDGVYQSGVIVSFVNDSEFKKLLKENGLDETIYMNKEAPLGLISDGGVVFDSEKEKYTTINLINGDSCEISATIQKEIEGYSFYGSYTDEDGKTVAQYSFDDEPDKYVDIPAEEAYTEFTLKAGKTIYTRPFYIDKNDGMIMMIYPLSLADYVMPEFYAENQSSDFYITSDNHTVCYENLKQSLIENGYSANNIYDYAEEEEATRNIITVIRVFSYGFIVLISLISAANVFNTISTNISLRRREFAMLKSVGITSGGLNGMMNFECLLYGSRALLFGLPVSVVFTYLIYRAVDVGYSTKFHLPWGAIGIVVFSVFAVVFVTMMYSMRKIKKDNPIEALKNENL